MKFTIRRTSGDDIKYPGVKKELVFSERYDIKRAEEFLERNKKWLETNKYFTVGEKPITEPDILLAFWKNNILNSTPKELVKKIDNGGIDTYTLEYTIDIENLSDLMNLVKQEKNIIVTENHLEIYDDYRE